MAARHLRTAAVTAVLVGSLLLAACTGGTPTPTPTGSAAPSSSAPATTSSQPARPFVPPFVGTLGTQTGHAEEESNSGVRVAMLELNWGKYEPDKGRFDLGYERDLKARAQQLRDAGMLITLGLGLHFTPGWVLDEPDSRLIDENGDTSSQVDLTFNGALRDQAERYLRRAVAAIGVDNLWAVRVTGGGRSEVLYPNGGYWAFGPNALGGPELPSSLQPNPFPDFRPGSPGLTRQQIGQWYEWYLTALADTADWQMRVLRDAGFTGWFQILTPGVGVTPLALEQALERNLPDGLTGLGAAWQEIYRLLPDKRNVMAYVTSMADGSGGNAGCGRNDDWVPLRTAGSLGWSATRWIKRIADEYDLPMAGENPGYTASPEYQRQYTDTSADGLMAVTFDQARSCDLQGVYWAHDDQLWDGTVDPDQFFSYTSPDAGSPPAAPSE